ncbi:hypothetical protein YW5DRAFT_01915 [Streptomyces sp. Ncost-T6T-1]|uniref:DUF6907 domain-containing protein n=1 Tax=Streptomyces sp. Ncost-T6T-1 TaxID=1100828 RepID=UPI000804D388|nr:hypothetical protein [Streptomyces sp. Ncost-T6T-1]SBV00589.1 hypothetical protein YW5DRAFT_01915 [Streptomyces sp. Ncost-T6T-1]
MSADRTVTVHTTDRGAVTVPEPSWCVDSHDQRPEALADLGHRGPEHLAVFYGYEVARAELTQHPHAEESDRGIGGYVEMGHLARTLTPAELDELAALLVDYAGTLRHLARQLGTLKAGEQL